LVYDDWAIGSVAVLVYLTANLALAGNDLKLGIVMQPKVAIS